MEVMILSNINCVFDSTLSAFRISWSTETGSNIDTVAVCKISIQDPITFIDDVRYITAQNGYVDYKLTGEGLIHRFIVLGLRNESKYSKNQLQDYCRSFKEKNKITCQGLCLICNVYWNIIQEGSKASIYISSSENIPKGYIAYSYKLFNVKFMFPINTQIYKNNKPSRILSFFVPNGAYNLNVESPGSSIKLIHSKDTLISRIYRRLIK